MSTWSRWRVGFSRKISQLNPVRLSPDIGVKHSVSPADNPAIQSSCEIPREFPVSPPCARLPCQQTVEISIFEVF